MALSLSQRTGQNALLWEHSPWHIPAVPGTKTLVPRQMEWLHPVSSHWRTSGLLEGPLKDDGVQSWGGGNWIRFTERAFWLEMLVCMHLQDTDMKCILHTLYYTKLCPFSLLYLDAVVDVEMMKWYSGSKKKLCRGSKAENKRWSPGVYKACVHTVWAMFAYMWKTERERGVSLVLGAVRAELRALGSLPTPCGEVCASKTGTRASAAALLHTHKHEILTQCSFHISLIASSLLQSHTVCFALSPHFPWSRLTT